MNRYPHSPWSPAIAFAAAIAAIATIGLAVVVPANMTVQPAVDAATLAKREARPAFVTITLERVDVVAQPSPTAPVAAAEAEPRG